jgi:signal transduction histidine kinase
MITEDKSSFIGCPICGSRDELDSEKLRCYISDLCELRAPVNSVIGFSRALLNEQNGSLNDRQREDLDAVHSAGMHLLWLINEMIDITKIMTGRIELQPENLDLHETIDDILERAKPMFQDGPIQLRLELVNDRLNVRAEKQLVSRILFNLLGNALRFTHEGSVTIRTRRISQGKRQMVQVTVQDTGIGIAADDLDVVFEPFEQLKSTGPGLGLGLTIAKSLVEFQGGQMWVASELGVGSTFHFTLPVSGP